jgi:hypothetical protein
MIKEKEALFEMIKVNLVTNDPEGRVLDKFLTGIPLIPATRASFKFFLIRQ